MNVLSQEAMMGRLGADVPYYTELNTGTWTMNAARERQVYVSVLSY